VLAYQTKKATNSFDPYTARYASLAVVPILFGDAILFCRKVGYGQYEGIRKRKYMRSKMIFLYS
jgi:hypothetical protein